MTSSIQENFGLQYHNSLPQLGHSIAELLQFFGANRVYGVGGDFVANLINSLESTLAVLPSSNEMHAGFSACAQAEVAGLGVCLMTYTVGSLPCISAAALARTEGLPVIFLSGAPGENEIAQHALHHTVHPHSAWHTDLNAALNAFKALGIRAERLQGQRHTGQPNIAAEQCLSLLSHAYINRQPVYIEIPRDLVNLATQALSLPANLDALLAPRLNLTGAEFIAAEIIEKLAHSSAPLLFLGEKLRLNPALLASLVQLCKRHQIPYAVTWFAKGMVDEADALCLGCYNGVFSHTIGKIYIETMADYVLEIGTSIFPSDTNNAFGSQTHAIDNHPNKTMLKGTAMWEQDILAVISILDTITQLTPIPRSQPASDFINNKPALIDENRQRLEPLEPLSYANLAKVINAAQITLPRPYIFIPEVGNAFFASFELETLGNQLGRSFFANPWYAAMGTSLPYARAIADELQWQQCQQPILVITGDGGFNFQSNELINLQKQNANITILYMRNNVFHLGKAGNAPIYHCNHQGFDPKILIQAYGGVGHVCQTITELLDTLKRTATGGLHLIEINTPIALEQQSEISRKLNSYIGFKNGDPTAMRQWQSLCGNSQEK
ncbi:thiamine pyrophosphate enzyme-like TPP binding region [Shewanella denitrificans OS217]|uniref:pyruvate decarboxylase n=1 Tax=Shewanella denitrificans (strain OS217 / ATCC BAA-1090 / DSM 15013) TaxID=318161 RepID=Q12PG4_SHEDO|nr:thiamine pyrophosphate-binding protein [Shewanella denitrificans]ABE54662.1 thiamine pyrophosphate enzyme-like TPP binding region [Shewanella denitrificans OS217]